MKTLIFFLLSFPAIGALTFTPAALPCSSITTVASQTCLVPPVVSGNLIWIAVTWAGGGCAAGMTVTDGVNPTYTIAGTQSQAGATSVKSGIYYTVATTTSSLITVTATNGGGCFITVLPAVITGQAASGFADETPKANSTSANTITCTFTRTGNELLTVAANYNSNPATWSTAGSTGTFTTGTNQTNGACCQPGGQFYQYVTSGTTYNAVIGTGGGANAGITCSGFSIKESLNVVAPKRMSVM